jgi:hypothetical protein
MNIELSIPEIQDILDSLRTTYYHELDRLEWAEQEGFTVQAELRRNAMCRLNDLDLKLCAARDQVASPNLSYDNEQQ